MPGSRSLETSKKRASGEKGGDRGLSPALARFSRQFVFSIHFSGYLGAWNRLIEELITNINAVKVSLDFDYVWREIPPGNP